MDSKKVLLEVQENLTGMSKYGYSSSQICKMAIENITINVVEIIIDDIEGMDNEEILNYLNSYKTISNKIKELQPE